MEGERERDCRMSQSSSCQVRVHAASPCSHKSARPLRREQLRSVFPLQDCTGGERATTHAPGDATSRALKSEEDPLNRGLEKAPLPGPQGQSLAAKDSLPAAERKLRQRVHGRERVCARNCVSVIQVEATASGEERWHIWVMSRRAGAAPQLAWRARIPSTFYRWLEPTNLR